MNRDTEQVPPAVEHAVAYVEGLTVRGQRLLSAFVDTSREAGGRSAATGALREACQVVRLSVPVEEHGSFDRAVDRAVECLSGAELGAPGFALFVRPDGVATLVPLPARPLESAAWEERPAVCHLTEALLPPERVRIALYDEGTHRNRCVTRSIRRNRAVPGPHSARGRRQRRRRL